MKEKLLKILAHPARVHVGVGVVSFAAGVAVGYLFSKRGEQEVYFDGELVEPKEGGIFVIDAKDHPSHKEPDMMHTPMSVIREKIEPIQPKEAPPEEPILTEVTQTVEVTTRNVFAQSDTEWDYEVEVAKRTPAEPYVIHADEFHADENGYAQVSWTYYAGDNTMAGEDDSPIYDWHRFTGDLKFGHGSNDPIVVYIRNEKRHAEYEIMRHEGNYEDEVGGLDSTEGERAKHLSHSRVPKFRQE